MPTKLPNVVTVVPIPLNKNPNTETNGATTPAKATNLTIFF